MSRLNLFDKERNKINITAIGLVGLKLFIPSPSYTTVTETLDDGRNIVIDKYLNPRPLIADFMTKASRYEDALQQKYELYSLLGNGKEFFIEQNHRPGILWKCHLEGWEPEHIGSLVTTFSVPLLCVDGKAETRNVVNKKFNSSIFPFKNEGNQVIDPRKQNETEITFKGASTNLSITNHTTGDEWKYNGATSPSDIIQLKGVQSFKNATSIFGRTNKKLLTIAVGNNEFTVSGASGDFELTISTRFYFL